jgi:mono/diheme cytochrome c family protein
MNWINQTFLAACLVAGLAGCDDGGDDGGAGGAEGAGGMIGMAGVPAMGGAPAMGGTPGLGGAPTPSNGHEVYMMRVPGGNTFACATCHALQEPAADGMRRAGHAIGDATRRPSYKGGRLTELRDAVNSCLTEWMRAPAWAEDDPSWIMLRAWLDTQAGMAAEAPAVALQIVQPPAPEALEGGDGDAGRALFNTSCGICHGVDASGSIRAPGLLGLALEAPYIARRVRTSGAAESPTYDGLTGGAMPFWGADRLSDLELRDLVAFIRTAEPEPDDGAGGSGAGGSGGGGGGGADGGGGAGGGDGCPSTHPLVGTTAELTGRFHGVRGTVTVVDDCSIRVDDFFFDGNGIDVRLYGASDLTFANGFIMGEDLKNFPVGYENDTVVGTLPDDKTLDDLGAVSVWCVPVGVSFGDVSLR